MKKSLILFLCIIGSFSCVSQKKDVIAKSTIKFEGKNINLRELICTNGFYRYPNFQSNENIIFFEDGTFIKFISRKQIENNQQVVKLSDYANYMEYKGQTNLIGYRGIYTIKQDTIIVHIYRPPTLLVAWSLDEEQYKVIDQKTIKRISIRGLLKTDEEYYKESGRSFWIKDEENMHFIPVDSLPASDDSLKKYKWMWRNESDWKAYMERVKAEKQKNKKK